MRARAVKAHPACCQPPGGLYGSGLRRDRPHLAPAMERSRLYEPENNGEGQCCQKFLLDPTQSWDAALHYRALA